MSNARNLGNITTGGAVGATTASVNTEVANLVDSAPGTLNTLNELAAALGDDANFSTTVTNSIATKLPLAGGTLTGDLTISSGTSGDATLTIESDTDNNNEFDNPKILFKQDGGYEAGGMRMSNNNTIIWNGISDASSLPGNGGGGISFYTGSVSGQDNATLKMHIKTDGAVGIGTNNPSSKLHVEGDIKIHSDGQTNGGACLQIDNTNTSNAYPKAIEAFMDSMGTNARHQILLGKDGSTNDTGSIAFYYVGNASSSNRLEFGLWGSSSTLNVLGSGNVGIGTTGPSQKLHVSSADHTRVLITGGTDKYAELQFENDAQKFSMGVQNDDKFFLYNSTGTSQVLTIDTSDNIGFGTQSPSAPIDVVTNSVVYAAEFTQSNTSNGDGVLISVGSTAAADYALTVRSDAGNTSVLAAKADGKVGIGTFTPSYKLHSETSSGTDYAGYFRNTSGSGNSTSLIARGGANNTSANFQVQDYNGNADFTVTGVGKVGIGTTSPYAILQTQQDVTGEATGISLVNNNVDGSADAVGISFGFARDNGYLFGFNAIKWIKEQAWTTAPSTVDAALTFSSVENESLYERLRIKGNGNVGIGDTNPGKKLAVNGTASMVAGFNDPGLTITGGTTLQNNGKIKLTGAGTGCDHIEIVNDGNSMVIGVERSAGSAIMGNTYGYASVIGSVTNNALHFGINNTTRMRLETAGNLFFPEIGNQGDLTFPICSVSNSGTGNQYLHVQFQATGGDMLHIHFKGYDYGGRYRSGGAGGYVYNTSGQAGLYSSAVDGHCAAVYQNTQNRVELVVDTGGGASGNKWGSYVFYGGTDTITNNSPLRLVQYAWNASTSRLYT